MSSARKEEIIKKGFIKSLIDGTLEIKDLAGINIDLDIARQAYLQGVQETTQALIELVKENMATAIKQDDIIEQQGLSVTYGLSSDTLLKQVDDGSAKAPLTLVYAKACEVLVAGFGLITAKVTTKPYEVGKTIYASLYLNGVLQEEYAQGSMYETTRTFDPLQIVEGDLIQLYVKAEDITPPEMAGYWKNFRLYATETLSSLSIQQNEE